MVIGISVFMIQNYDKENNTNYMQTIISNLSAQTGLTYSESSTGMLVYKKE